MKHFLISTILLAFASNAIQAQEYFDGKVFKKPVEHSVPYANETCRMTGISASNAFTDISFEFTTGFLIRGEAGYSINYDAALVDPATGNRYPLLFATGNMEKAPFKKTVAQSDDPYKFSLVFPSVPADVKTVNLEMGPGLSLDWSFNNIHIGNVRRQTLSGINSTPDVKTTAPAVKVIETIREDNMFFIIFQYTAPKLDFYYFPNLNAVDPATGTKYAVDLMGMPISKEYNIYMKKDTVDGGMLCIKDITADVATLNVNLGTTPIIEGLAVK